MPKFCGNCGFQLADDAKICGNCGTPCADVPAGPPAPVSGAAYVDTAKRAKNKKIAIFVIGAVILIVIAVIVVGIISSFVGYKGAVRKIMNAYEDYDMDTILAMSSDVYYYMDENYVEEYFGKTIASDLDEFGERVGHNYKLSYKITETYEMPKYRSEDVLNALSLYEDFDVDIISEILVVELEVTAKDNETRTMPLELTLTKEDGSWRLLYMS